MHGIRGRGEDAISPPFFARRWLQDAGFMNFHWVVDRSSHERRIAVWNF